MHHKTFCVGQSEMFAGNYAEVLNILSPAALSRSFLVVLVSLQTEVVDTFNDLKQSWRKYTLCWY